MAPGTPPAKLLPVKTVTSQSRFGSQSRSPVHLKLREAEGFAGVLSWQLKQVCVLPSMFGSWLGSILGLAFGLPAGLRSRRASHSDARHRSSWRCKPEILQPESPTLSSLSPRSPHSFAIWKGSDTEEIEIQGQGRDGSSENRRRSSRSRPTIFTTPIAN